MDGKTRAYLFIGGVALLIVMFTAGAYTGQKAGRAKSDSVYLNRLQAIANLNTDLQGQNRELTSLNESLTKRYNDIARRIREAEDTLGELNLRASTDANSIQRIIDNLGKIDKAVQALTAYQ